MHTFLNRALCNTFINQIIYLIKISVSDIPYLRVLHLDHNPLNKVEANAFEMIPQLVSLGTILLDLKE